MDDRPLGIWLEVAEVRLETGHAQTAGAITQSKGAAAPPTSICTVLLKADREQPKPFWWPVEDTAGGGSGEKAVIETYKAILNEIDKKRVVLAWLSSTRTGDRSLRCEALRFQSPELGTR